MNPLPELNLEALFSYNPETGILSWNYRPREHFKNDLAYKIWNARYSGEPAGSPITGYLYVRLNMKNYAVHKIAWYLQTGEWVELPYEIDHKNRIRHDNRWDNLRKVTKSMNMKNKLNNPYPEGANSPIPI